VTDAIWAAVPAARAWLDAANGTDDAELSSRILKLTEESGEVATAWMSDIASSRPLAVETAGSRSGFCCWSHSARASS